MKKLSFLFAFSLIAIAAHAQNVWLGTAAEISFFSKTAIENIEAKSKVVGAAMNLANKSLFFKVKNTTFKFPKALMEEHFNENYMESEKYPTSEFKGTIVDSTNSDLTKNGTYSVWVVGKLTIHGVTKDYKTRATFTTKDGKIRGVASFRVRLDDHKIERPSVVAQSLAETIDVSVDVTFEPQK